MARDCDTRCRVAQLGFGNGQGIITLTVCRLHLVPRVRHCVGVWRRVGVLFGAHEVCGGGVIMYGFTRPVVFNVKVFIVLLVIQWPIATWGAAVVPPRSRSRLFGGRWRWKQEDDKSDERWSVVHVATYVWCHWKRKSTSEIRGPDVPGGIAPAYPTSSRTEERRQLGTSVVHLVSEIIWVLSTQEYGNEWLGSLFANGWHWFKEQPNHADDLPR